MSDAATALACLDLTDLSDDCTAGDVAALCAKATTPHGAVAAVCVWPRFVKHARAALPRDVAVATVVNFPYGADRVAPVVAETEQALADGADEIDLVLPYRAFAEGRADVAAKMLDAVRVATGPKLMKVILETGMLHEPGVIRRAADLAVAEGADFLKTSTGKVATGATPEAARVMLDAIAASGARVGLKVSGGVRTLEDAETYLALAREAMGADWPRPRTFRIGASALLTALLAALDGAAAPNPAEGY